MKRLLIVALLAMGIIATGSAQKSNVSKAKNKALNVESPDFEGAKEAIAAALQDESTKNSVEQIPLSKGGSATNAFLKYGRSLP